MSNIKMRPSPDFRSGNKSDIVYKKYGNVSEEYIAVKVEELNADVREISEESDNGNARDEDKYVRDYEPSRHVESNSILQTITKKEMCVIFLIVITSGLAFGLSVYFTKSSTVPPTLPSTNSKITTPTTITTESLETVFYTSGKSFLTSLVSRYRVSIKFFKLILQRPQKTLWPPL